MYSYCFCHLNRFLFGCEVIVFGVRGLAELQHARIHIEPTKFGGDGAWHELVILKAVCNTITETTEGLYNHKQYT